MGAVVNPVKALGAVVNPMGNSKKGLVSWTEARLTLMELLSRCILEWQIKAKILPEPVENAMTIYDITKLNGHKLK